MCCFIFYYRYFDLMFLRGFTGRAQVDQYIVRIAYRVDQDTLPLMIELCEGDRGLSKDDLIATHNCPRIIVQA